MFKFYRLFSLEHDVLPLIPADQFPPEAKAYLDQLANNAGLSMGVPQLQSSSSTVGTLPFVSTSMQKTLPSNFNTPPNRNSFRTSNQFRLGSSYSNIVNSTGSNSNQSSPLSGGGIRFSSQSTIDEEDDEDDIAMVDEDDMDNNRNGSKSNDVALFNLYHSQKCIAQMINLRIIGRDHKSGTLVIARTARINDIPKTCIDLYDVSSRKYLACILDYSGHIVNATISSDSKRSFLVFTVNLPEASVQEVNNNSQKLVYSSFIYEINKKNNSFHPLEKSSTPIIYHSLHIEQKYFHLLSIQTDECSTLRVQIQADEKNSGGLALHPKINLKKVLITKKYSWYQYDDINHIFYALQYVKLRSLNSPSENLLKKWVFKDGKVSNSGEFPIFLNLTTDKVSPNVPFPFTFPLNRPEQVFQNIHIVQLDCGACLCHQEESNNTSIKISVYFLHLRQRLKYSIPLINIDEGVLSIQVTRVLFDSIGDYLMIYVPGHFIQFIDCSSSDHEPSLGLTLYHNLPTNITEMTSHDSADLVSVRIRPLPTKISTSIIPYYSNSKSGKEQNLLFDYHYGILYKYQFDREAISNLFERETMQRYGLDAGADLRTLHLVMIHMQDSELVYKILVKMSNDPSLITSDFLKEYILGQTYLELKTNKLDTSYLQTLPMTCSDSMDISTLRSKLRDIELGATNLAVHSIFLSGRRDEIGRKRLKSFEVVKQETGQKEPGSAIMTSIFNFFGVDGSESNTHRRSHDGFASPTKSPINSKIALKMTLDDYEEDPQFEINSYTSNLADHWHQVSQRESREKLMEWSTSYRNVQINTINSLYQTLVKHIGNVEHHGPISEHPKKSQLFRVMEKLYIAIEELNCPFPKDFYSTFTILGFYCLPRKLFLQYLQKGLFVVTGSFINELKKFYDNELTQEDSNFINQVILHLKDKSKMLGFIHKWPLNTGVMIDHLIASLVQKGEDPKGDVEAMGPDFSNSNFIPLTSLFNHLEACAAANSHPRGINLPTSPSKHSFNHSSSPNHHQQQQHGSSGSLQNDHHNLSFVKLHYENEITKMLQNAKS